MQVDSQFIDENGKTRILNVLFMKKIVPIFTLPMQPLNVMISNSINSDRFSYKFILDFCKDQKLTITKKYVLKTAHTTQDETKGLWVKREDEISSFIGFINIEGEINQNFLDEIEQTDEYIILEKHSVFLENHDLEKFNKPDSKKNISKLKKYLESKKITHVLKRYVAYTW